MKYSGNYYYQKKYFGEKYLTNCTLLKWGYFDEKYFGETSLIWNIFARNIMQRNILARNIWQVVL